MLIAELDYTSGNVFGGDYRITAVDRHETKGGKPYLALCIADMSGDLPVYVWDERLQQILNIAGPMDCVRLRGQLRNFNNSWIADVQEVKGINEPYADPVKLIPADSCPLPDGLDLLHSVLDALTTPELRNFAHSVLSQDSLAFPFVSGPASLEHHHNHPGGLLEHSLECTDIVAGMKWFPTHIRELGVVAALFHDVGKTVTMTGDMKRTSTGYLVDHDLLNLELLSHSLQILDEEWPDGGRALRYILSWDKGRFHPPVPLMTIAEAVRFADRCSTGINMEDKVFEGLPDWQQFANAAAGTRLWRPGCPLSALDGGDSVANGRGGR